MPGLWFGLTEEKPGLGERGGRREEHFLRSHHRPHGRHLLVWPRSPYGARDDRSLPSTAAAVPVSFVSVVGDEGGCRAALINTLVGAPASATVWPSRLPAPRSASLSAHLA